MTWGDVQRWEDGSGRITVIRSKTDAEAQGAVVAITPAAMTALSAIRTAGAEGRERVFGLSESQIARRAKAIAKAAGLLGVRRRLRFYRGGTVGIDINIDDWVHIVVEHTDRIGAGTASALHPAGNDIF